MKPSPGLEPSTEGETGMNAKPNNITAAEGERHASRGKVTKPLILEIIVAIAINARS